MQRRHSARCARWKLGDDRFNTGHYDVDSRGRLVAAVHGHRYVIADIARRHGTPCEIMFPEVLTARFRGLVGDFAHEMAAAGYGGRFVYHYPIKVNQRRDFVEPLVRAGADLETSSAAELWIVSTLRNEGLLRPGASVLCNGQKTAAYVRAIRDLRAQGVNVTPIIEDLSDLPRFAALGGPVGVRANLETSVASHWDPELNHFGIRASDLRVLPPIPGLRLLTYHVTSQIERVEDFTACARRAAALYAELRLKLPALRTVSIGGGAGVPYGKRRFYSGRDAAARVIAAFRDICAATRVPEPDLICEWGRYVAAPAQLTVYRVTWEKTVRDHRAARWYGIDGSFMNDLADTWGIGQRWHVLPANRMQRTRLRPVWLAGASCDNDDVYRGDGRGVPMPALDAREPQLIAVLDTGAYQDSLGGRHCLIPPPAWVVVKGGRVRCTRPVPRAEEDARAFGW